MSYSTQGASNRQIYDCCAYAQALQQSVDPLQYDLYFGAVENCNKCIDKKAWFKQDKEIVDIESDLMNMTRPLTRCDGYKYNPNCKTGPNCISTFDSNAPRILSPSLCPIVYNNIPVQTEPGYYVPDPGNVCLSENNYRSMNDVNTFEQWSSNNQKILGNNADPKNIFMFMNSCSNKPLYDGDVEKTSPYMLDNNLTSSSVPFPRMGYSLDQNEPIQPSNLMNNNLQMSYDIQKKKLLNNNMVHSENHSSNMFMNDEPMGVRTRTSNKHVHKMMNVYDSTGIPIYTDKSDYSTL